MWVVPPGWRAGRAAAAAAVVLSSTVSIAVAAVTIAIAAVALLDEVHGLREINYCLFKILAHYDSPDRKTNGLFCQMSIRYLKRLFER